MGCAAFRTAVAVVWALVQSIADDIPTLRTSCLGAIHACLGVGCLGQSFKRESVALRHCLCMTGHRVRRKKKWNGPLQYEDESGQLMMLPTDLVSPPGSGGTPPTENRQSCWHLLVQLCMARLSLHEGCPLIWGVHRQL